VTKKKTPVTKKKASKARKRPGGGGKLARSENVQVRLDPKLKFAAELASRKHRRTLSSFIEWAVEEAVKRVQLDDRTAYDVLGHIWDVYEADRFIKLAHQFPLLLTHDEELLWKLIRELQFAWYTKEGLDENIDIASENWHSIDLQKLRSEFQLFKQVNQGELSKKELGMHLINMIDDVPF